MLRKELHNKDIPHRTALRNRIMEIWQQHLKDLEKEMKVLSEIPETANYGTQTSKQSLAVILSATALIFI